MNSPSDSEDNTTVVDTEALGDQIAQLAAHLEAAHYRLLRLIHQFDQAEGWVRCGARSCADWLSWRIGVGLNAAREKVRVARALAQLPLCSQALERGEVSFSKLRAITRVATAENEDVLLTYARHGTAAQVEKIVRRYRSVLRAQDLEADNDRHEARYLRSWTDEHGMLVIEGRLPPELAAPVLKALSLAQTQLSAASEPTGDGAESESDLQGDVTAVTSTSGGLHKAPSLRGVNPLRFTPETSEPTPTAAQRQADALCLVAQSALDHDMRCGSGGDRTQVVLHIDAEALTEPASGQDPLRCGPDAASALAAPEARSRAASLAAGPVGQCRFEQGDGGDIPAAAARRLSCDASVVTMQHGTDGSVLSVGRKTRTIPPAIRRALLARDERRCRFPGCNHQNFLHGHHIRHWAAGGKTKLDNLVLCCSFHHRLLHEGGFSVTAADDGTLTFRDPRGCLLPDAPVAPTVHANPSTALVATNRKQRPTESRACRLLTAR
jgi:hypothetical protein